MVLILGITVPQFKINLLIKHLPYHKQNQARHSKLHMKYKTTTYNQQD